MINRLLDPWCGRKAAVREESQIFGALILVLGRYGGIAKAARQLRQFHVKSRRTRTDFLDGHRRRDHSDTMYAKSIFLRAA